MRHTPAITRLLNYLLHRSRFASEIIIAGCLAALGSISLLAQGSLTPPGAPAPTMKTLDQLEPRTPISALPFTISASGSYYLTGSLTTTASGQGITINADNATLDLNGFEVIGNGGSSTVGIKISIGFSNATIRNGTVRNWSGTGISTANSAVSGVRVEAVRAIANGSLGISLGTGCTVVDCIASGNSSTGISVGDDSLVLRCTSRNNTGTADGIQTTLRCTVQDCVTLGNGVNGIRTGNSCAITNCRVSVNGGRGINAGNHCNVRDCTADSNLLGGIQCGTNSGAIGCTAISNTGAGFIFSTNARLSQCTAASNSGTGFSLSGGATVHGCGATANAGNGFSAGAGTVIADSAASSNTGASGISVQSESTVRGCSVSGQNDQTGGATSQGIFATDGCLIIACTVGGGGSAAGTLTNTTGAGIVVGSESTVRDCKIRDNSGDGIRANSNCRIVGNSSGNHGNGTGQDGAGIHVSSTRNRIEGNHVTLNRRGIDVDSVSNVVFHNTASGNTVNFDIVANNSVGAIVNPANSVAIAGNGALASSLGTTDPWANISE